MTGKKLTMEPLAPQGKIRNLPARAAEADPGTRVRVIARLKKAGYTPPDLKVRSRIDAHLVTAECALGELEDLELDPEVESIEVAETLPAN